MHLTDATLTFVSNNESKLDEYRLLLDMPNLLRAPMSKAESSTTNLDELVREKCEKASLYVEPPLFVEHTALGIVALKGFPGVITGQTLSMTSNAQLLDMIAKQAGENRRAIARIAIGYLPAAGSKVHVVEAETPGYISSEPRGANGFGWDEIFVPEGESKTYAEMTLEEKNRTSMRAKVGNSFKVLLRDFKAAPGLQPSRPTLPDGTDKSLERPPEGLWQAVTSFVWPKKRWAQVLVVAILALLTGAFAAWASLPDTQKEKIIEWIRGR